MLRIYDDMLACVAMMRGLAGAIERHDPDLGRQMRRAASSVVLNTAEGSGSFGRMRTARYRTALGSARAPSRACGSPKPGATSTPCPTTSCPP